MRLTGSTRSLPDLGGRIRQIRRLAWNARLAALRAGLQVASPDEAGPLAVELAEMAAEPTDGLLLERRRARAEDALGTLVGLWERLPADARGLAIGVGRGRWEAAVAAALSQPESIEEARSAAMLGADLGEVTVAGPLVTALAVDDDRTRRAAEIGLLSLSMRARGLDGVAVRPEVEASELLGLDGGRIEGIERATLDVHLADAAWGFASHQRRLALLAGLAALDLAGLSAARRDQSGASGSARLLRLVQESSHVAHRALRQIVRWSPAPMVRERALLLLSEASIAEAALERVSRAEGREEHEAVLRLAHLGLRPRRRRLLAMVRVVATGVSETKAEEHRPSTATVGGTGSGTIAVNPTGTIANGQALPDARMLAGMDDECRAGAAMLAGLVEADDQARVSALKDALGDASPLVRLRAMAALPRAELAHYCFDADPFVARSATLRWSSAGMGLRGRAEPGERSRVAGLLSRSPHEHVRRLAAQESPRETPWIASSPASRASAWRLAVRERDGLLTQIRRRVKGTASDETPATGSGANVAMEVENRLAAIQVARRLGLARVIAMDLAALLEPARGGSTIDPRLAATAAAALGDVDDAVSRDALRRALSHADARVRANAVEAIGVQRLAVEDATTGRDRDYGSLIELKGDPHHRVRANAIRALLQLPPACPKERKAARRANGVLEGKPRVYEPVAVDALAAMLGDERPAHRLAGVWLAGRVLAGGQGRLGTAWNGLSARLTEIGGQDADDRVRARAAGVCERVSATLRASWSGNAGAAELIGPAGIAGGARAAGVYEVEPVEPAGTM